MKKVIIMFGLLGAMVMASIQLSYAVSVSSQPVRPEIGFVGTPFLIQENESISYIIASTGGAVGTVMSTVAFQYSSNNQNWYTELTTAPAAAAGTWSITGELPIKLSKTYYRFKILGSSGNATEITMYDNDDEVMVVKNNKNVDTLILSDESLQLKGSIRPTFYKYEIDASSPLIYISTGMQFKWGRTSPKNKDTWTGPSVKLNSSYIVLTSTFGGSVRNNVTLTARPTITTETAKNGDVLMFESNISSITFTSGTNTGLLLGSSTRILKLHDILQLIFRNGYWREVNYTNCDVEPE